MLFPSDTLSVVLSGDKDSVCAGVMGSWTEFPFEIESEVPEIESD
jgi:hypothetical protein